ncbi:MAG: hypothetical protein OEO77_08510 [Acidimicrobiia bacterium]|nr:hypothetical protein [Acidimicrobiia bacterium]
MVGARQLRVRRGSENAESEGGGVAGGVGMLGLVVGDNKRLTHLTYRRGESSYPNEPGDVMIFLAVPVVATAIAAIAFRNRADRRTIAR